VLEDSGHFQLLGRDGGSAARRGELRTAHGTVRTPVFMPVGTQASVKALMPAQVRACGAQIILGNTYHLNLRPGPDLIADFGGLHRFMGWEGPILTDSGGYQVFSLAKLRRISEAGIEFQSHLDGARVRLDPAGCMAIQDRLGSDIAMVLDECPEAGADRAVLERAVGRTISWAGQCRDEAERRGMLDAGRHVFGIVQGGTHEDLRRDCAAALAALDFPGYAVGGVSVGESEAQMHEAVAMSLPHLPAERPRYVMGVGTPPQLLRMLAQGADLFDCVMPTRLARHGSAFTPDGPINLKNEGFRADARPLVEGMDNETCRRFTRAYLRHLVMAGELLAHVLLSLHNVHFFCSLLDEARARIEAGDFARWHREWCARYEAGGG